LVDGKYAMKIEQQFVRFTWAEKAALFTAGAFLALWALFWSLAVLAIGSLGAGHLWKYMGVHGLELVLLIAGLVWITMRSVDFMKDNSTNRFSRLASTPLPIPLPQA
jgi:hypothetical protein